MIEHIYSVKEMLSKYQALHPKILLLSDFELMDKHHDGIDTILKLNHIEHSILVTARDEELAIQERCLEAGIRRLPKSLVSYVKVISDLSESLKHQDASKLEIASMVGEYQESADIIKSDDKLFQTPSSKIILIDDDRLVRFNWAQHCNKKGLPFSGFQSIEEFIFSSSAFEKETKIYIDSNLGDGILGEVESEKIFNLGFLNLYISTGYEKNSIVKPSWIKEIYSKSPENIL